MPWLSGILALLQQWMVACKVILAVQPARCAARIRAALASLAKQARFAREERQKQKQKQLAFGSQLAALDGKNNSSLAFGSACSLLRRSPFADAHITDKSNATAAIDRSRSARPS
jgi:uncharacterized membrane protein